MKFQGKSSLNATARLDDKRSAIVAFAHENLALSNETGDIYIQNSIYDIYHSII